MAQDQLDLTPQDTLALSAAMRRPLTDLFTRIRAIAAHEEMLTPYLRQELEVLLRDGYRLLRLADSLSTVECYELPPNAAVFPLWQQLQECLESTRLLLGANGRTLCYDLPEENDMVRGDAEMLMRAILHLICNGLDAADDAVAPVTVRGSVAGDQAILTILDEGRGIPPEQLQVLSPTRKGSVGTPHLNRALQAAVNPPAPEKREKAFGTTIFREGDRVMQVKNNYQLEWEILGRYKIPVDKGVGVFNGDTGIMTEINEFAETATVEFEDGRQAEYSFKQLEELELAYAVTIHKSQGSEYPAVILPILSGPRMLMNRNLLYTAVTRARKCVTVVGSETTFAEMIRNEKQQQRYSSLDRRIRELDESEQKESAIGEKGLS